MNALVKPLTGLLGLVLTLLGIAGFFTDGMLLMFEVNATQSIVYLATGLIGLFAFNSSQLYSRWFLILFGFLYGVMAVLGLATGEVLDFFTVNMANNYLHLGISAACLLVGLGSRK